MNKAELIDAIASESGLSKADAKRALEHLARLSVRVLKKDGAVYVPDLGIFQWGQGLEDSCRIVSADERDGRRRRECVAFFPDAPGDGPIIQTYLENYLSDAMNEHAADQDYNADCEDKACRVGDDRSTTSRATLTVPSHQSMLSIYHLFDVPGAFENPPTFADIARHWGPMLGKEMEFLGLSGTLSESFVTDMMVSLEGKAEEAQASRKQIQVLKTSETTAILKENLGARTKLTPEQVDALLATLSSVVHGQLKKGDKVALIGFGSFSISKRAARTGRNPQTGKAIQIAAKNVVKFKAGADLSKKVN